MYTLKIKHALNKITNVNKSHVYDAIQFPVYMHD